MATQGLSTAQNYYLHVSYDLIVDDEATEVQNYYSSLTTASLMTYDLVSSSM
jgi:hypothetical protein